MKRLDFPFPKSLHHGDRAAREIRGGGGQMIFLGLLACVKHFYDEPLAISTRTSVGANMVARADIKENICDTLILGIYLPADERDQIRTALKQAREAGADAIADYRIENNTTLGLTLIFPIYAFQCWSVYGHAVKLTDGAPVADPEAKPPTPE